MIVSLILFWIFEGVSCNWNEWEAWTECSATICGVGSQERFRSCNYDLFGNDDCTESGKREEQPCNTHLTPCQYEWSNWGEATSCPVTCGEGLRERDRTCQHMVSTFRSCFRDVSLQYVLLEVAYSTLRRLTNLS